jgi:hypothetical protein
MIVPVVLGLMVCFLLLGCGNVTGGGGGGGGGTTSSIIYVSTTGSDDAGNGSATNPYQTIQKGLDVVVANGTVSVESGIYVENLTWPSTEGVTLRGASMSTTTLDANNVNRGILIEQAESVKTAKIEKMTITKAHRTAGSGAGMEISGTCYISSCEISDNYGGVGAGGLSLSGNGGRIENSIIHHNVSTGYYGGGMLVNVWPELVVINCTITSNEAIDGTLGKGGGVASYGGDNTIVNCIIYGNTAAVASNEVWFRTGYGYSLSITYSDIKGGYTGTGNLDVDPVFTSATDFHVGETALDTATTEGAPAVDYSGTTRSVPFTIGAYERITG